MDRKETFRHDKRALLKASAVGFFGACAFAIIVTVFDIRADPFVEEDEFDLYENFSHLAIFVVSGVGARITYRPRNKNDSDPNSGTGWGMRAGAYTGVAFGLSATLLSYAAGIPALWTGSVENGSILLWPIVCAAVAAGCALMGGIIGCFVGMLALPNTP